MRKANSLDNLKMSDCEPTPSSEESPRESHGPSGLRVSKAFCKSVSKQPWESQKDVQWPIVNLICVTGMAAHTKLVNSSPL